jgi:hypothetical protein
MLPCHMLSSQSILSPSPPFSSLRAPRAFCVKAHSHPRPCLSRYLAAKSRRMRISAKHTPKPFRLRSFKTQGLKSFRIRIFKKRPGEGGLLLTRNPTKDFCPERPLRERYPFASQITGHFSAHVSNLLTFKPSDLQTFQRRSSTTHYPLSTTHYSLLTSPSPRHRTQERIMTRRTHEK